MPRLVAGDVGERRDAGDVAHGPHALGRAAELVDLDALVAGLDADRRRGRCPSVRGVRPTATTSRSALKRSPPSRVTATPSPSASTFTAFSPRRTSMPSCSRRSSAEQLADRRVLAHEQPRRRLDDRDLGAVAREHLPELDADRAAAEHDRARGDLGRASWPRGWSSTRRPRSRRSAGSWRSSRWRGRCARPAARARRRRRAPRPVSFAWPRTISMPCFSKDSAFLVSSRPLFM